MSEINFAKFIVCFSISLVIAIFFSAYLATYSNVYAIIVWVIWLIVGMLEFGYYYHANNDEK